MTPRFPRTQRLAHPYALVTVDFIYTILWLSGFASVASFDSSGLCAKKCDSDGKNCSISSKCNLGKAVVGLGVFIFLFFALTTAMSVYGIQYWRTNGVLPGASRAPYGSTNDQFDKNAFSTADDEYGPVHGNDHDDVHEDVHDYAGEQFDTSSNVDTSYSGGYAPQNGSEVSHESYGGVSESRVHFPPANYAEGRTPIAI